MEVKAAENQLGFSMMEEMSDRNIEEARSIVLGTRKGFGWVAFAQGDGGVIAIQSDYLSTPLLAITSLYNKFKEKYPTCQKNLSDQ